MALVLLDLFGWTVHVVYYGLAMLTKSCFGTIQAVVIEMHEINKWNLIVYMPLELK